MRIIQKKKKQKTSMQILSSRGLTKDGWLSFSFKYFYVHYNSYPKPFSKKKKTKNSYPKQEL